MIPRTDKERIYQLEARVAELEAELREWRSFEKERQRLPVPDHLDRYRTFLRRGDRRAGGPAPATILAAMLDAPGRILSPDYLLQVTRFAYKGTKPDTSSRVMDVQVCKVRRALSNQGFRNVIESTHDRGWSIPAAFTQSIRDAIDTQ